MAKINRYENDFAGAIKLLKEVHLRAPTHLDTLMDLSICLAASNDDDEKRQAVGFAELGVRLHTDLKQKNGRNAAAAYAWALRQIGRNSEARRIAAQILQTKSDFSNDSGYFISQIMFDAGQSTLAEKLLEAILKTNKTFANQQAANELLKRIKAGS